MSRPPKRLRLCGAELTRREVAVLSLILAGNDYAAIAHALGISEHTVKQHAWHVRTAFGGKSWARIGFLVGRADARRDGKG